MIYSLIRYAAGLRHIEIFPGTPGALPVVLVHGLLHRGIMMRRFARWFSRRGRRAILYDYRTTRHHIFEHGLELARFLRELGEPQIDLVTHSMGGLLTRVALSGFEGTPMAAKIGRVVMVAPPNHGSQMAEDVARNFPPSKLLVRPLDELSNREGAVCRGLPVPRGFEIGIIAGDADGKVSLESTRLEGMRDHVIVHARHVNILFLPEARGQILAFLETGRFLH